MYTCSYCSKNVYTVPVKFTTGTGKTIEVPRNCWRHGRNACKEKCHETDSACAHSVPARPVRSPSVP